MWIPSRRRSIAQVVTILVITAVLAAWVKMETGEMPTTSLPSPGLVFSSQPADPPAVHSSIKTAIQPEDQPEIKPVGLLEVQPTPTITPLGPLTDPDLDLYSGPVDIPIELKIPAIDIDVSMVGVGLIEGNVMDAPKGPIGDPLWNQAYWYRGSGIPGEVGTATIAGHVNNALGLPSTFTYLHKLRPGDMIIIHYTKLNLDIRFIVDQIKIYTLLESSYPGVLTKIFGVGPAAGLEAQPALDGLSHLTLITCAGDMVKSQFDHRTVIYATRSE